MMSLCQHLLQIHQLLGYLVGQSMDDMGTRSIVSVVVGLVEVGSTSSRLAGSRQEAAATVHAHQLSSME